MKWSALFQPLSSSAIRFDDVPAKDRVGRCLDLALFGPRRLGVCTLCARSGHSITDKLSLIFLSVRRPTPFYAKLISQRADSNLFISKPVAASALARRRASSLRYPGKTWTRRHQGVITAKSRDTYSRSSDRQCQSLR